MLRDRRVALAYFAGHRHGTENNTGPLSEPAHAFTLGGGGGWSCDGDQGYLVGEVLSDGTWDNLRLVRMERSECCGPPRSKAAWDAGCLAHSDCDQARMNWDFNSCCAAYDCELNGNCGGGGGGCSGDGIDPWGGGTYVDCCPGMVKMLESGREVCRVV